MTEFHLYQLIGLITVTFFAAWLPPRKWQIPAVTLTTMAFIAWLSPISLLFMSISCGICFLAAKQKSRLPITIGLAIGYIAIQYLAIRLIQQQEQVWWQLGSLIGLAYYSCRNIHYLVEVYKNTITPNFVKFWQYHFFFPVLVTGPIHRYHNFERQCQRRRWEPDATSNALQRILLGYFKVVVIANYVVLELFQSALERVSDVPVLQAWLSSLNDWIYLYLQFAGWSDIAIGFALVAGIRLEENFNRPYLAVNLIDFWQRWHMTLSGWCRDYVFTPVLAFSRQPFLAVFLAMVVMGLWHEVSLYYLLWAGYHASGIALCRMFQRWQEERHVTYLHGTMWCWCCRAMTLGFIVSGAPITASVESMLTGGLL